MTTEVDKMNASFAASKQRLRSLMREKLAAISPQTVAVQSSRVFDTLQSFQPYVDAKSISIYLSMPAGEIQTDAVVRHALQSGKSVFVPYLHKPVQPPPDTPSRVMDMVRLTSINDYESLRKDKWGIPSIDPATVAQRQRILGEPGESSAVSTSALNLILMPGVAFDTDPDSGSLRRLGHGKGFYDHFIQRYAVTTKASKPGRVLLYGLALTEQYLEPESGESVPVATHDQPLDGIVLGNGQIKNAAPPTRQE